MPSIYSPQSCILKFTLLVTIRRFTRIMVKGNWSATLVMEVFHCLFILCCFKVFLSFFSSLLPTWYNHICTRKSSVRVSFTIVIGCCKSLHNNQSILLTFSLPCTICKEKNRQTLDGGPKLNPDNTITVYRQLHECTVAEVAAKLDKPTKWTRRGENIEANKLVNA